MLRFGWRRNGRSGRPRGLPIGRLAGGVLIAAALAGGQTRVEPVETALATSAQPPRVEPPDSSSLEVEEMRSTYLLGPDDSIVVQVPEAEEITNDPLRIGADGYLRLPLVGRLRAEGLTPAQLEREITARLGAYLKRPEAIVTVQEFRSQPVSVIGAVNDPGVHQLEGSKSLVEMLSLAGGLSEEAGAKVKITRRREWGAIPLAGATVDETGRFSIAEVDLDDVMEARRPELNVLIKPEDVISVPRAEMVYVIGAVERAGGFVLNDRESVSILQALALAGGLDSKAKKKKAKILRTIGESEDREEITVNLKRVMAGEADDVGLRREDILFIPTSGSKAFGTRAIQTAVNAATGIAVWRVGNSR